jgi:hypothetical protein
MNLKESGDGLIQIPSRNLSGRTEEDREKLSIAGVKDEM